ALRERARRVPEVQEEGVHSASDEGDLTPVRRRPDRRWAGYARRTMRVGLISDTHGLLRPEALAALDGVALILHAGDVRPPHILHELERFAPVHAVEGNTDDPAMRLPPRVTLTLAD